MKTIIPILLTSFLSIYTLYWGFKVLNGIKKCGENKPHAIKNLIDFVCTSYGSGAAFFVSLIISSLFFIWMLKIIKNEE